jgi:uncharacterized membrane protein
MASADLATQYIILMIATLLFTVLAIMETEQNPKSIILQAFSGVLWLLCGFAQIIAGDTTSILTYAVSYLWYGFAVIFIIATFYNSFSLLKARKGPEI